MFKEVRNTIAKFFLGNSLTQSGLWSWLMPGNWSKADLLKQYQRVMYTVVTAIAQDSAKISFIVYRKGDAKKTPVKSHPFLDLMRMPNPDNSQFQFLEMHFTYLKLAGESYWYYAKGQRTQQIRQVYLLRPDLMEVMVNKDERGTVGGYVMNKPNGAKETFDKEEILHFKMPNPANPYYGYGTIEAAKTYIETEQYASDWTKNALFNSGRPSGIVTIKGTLDPEQFKSLKKQFKSEYQGTQNAGKTLMLNGSDGIDYQKLGMELSELALKDLKDMTRDDIMMMFRVSKTMLGISEGVNLNNARESRAMFKESIIVGEWDRLVDHINSFLMPLFDDKYQVHYILPDLMTGVDKMKEWDLGINRWLTMNDIRSERGLDPIEGGDVIYQSLALVPLTAESEIPKPPAPDSGVAPQGDSGTAPSKGDTGSAGSAGTEGKKAKNQNMKQIAKDQAAKLIRVGKYVDLLAGSQDKWMVKYHEAMQAEFKTQLAEILKQKKKDVMDGWEFNTTTSEQRLIGSLTPISDALMQEVAKLALSMAHDNNTEFIMNERAAQFIKERILKMSAGVNETTIKQLTKTLTEGMQNGESVAQLRDRVKEVYDMADTTRATQIARTESIAVGNQGALEAYRQSPMVEGKEWSAAADACDFCAEIDGKIIGLEENYAQDGETITVGDKSFVVDYGDVEEPPLHVNCRCALLPVAL